MPVVHLVLVHTQYLFCSRVRERDQYFNSGGVLCILDHFPEVVKEIQFLVLSPEAGLPGQEVVVTNECFD